MRKCFACCLSKIAIEICLRINPIKQRLKIHLKGLLQGIGFRPFVYRLATAHSLVGWVANEADDVLLEVEGESTALLAFVEALRNEVPACGHIDQFSQQNIALTHEHGFQFASSRSNDQAAAFVCPDIAVCADCVKELFTPSNRRYLHPFISCCHCGPRYSIITALPYDRCYTSLRDFPLCERCAIEYRDPLDRRFYAQTIACPDCGPQLRFCHSDGVSLYEKQAALQAAVAALQAGQIVAIKGIGGFQLLVDATNSAAVMRLRERKHRASKPFAVMLASLEQAQSLCELSDVQQRSLQSAAAPIVLASALYPSPTGGGHGWGIADAVAPQQALLGIMLPYSPLHHLLMAALQTPVVATSGNQHDEPICIDNEQAFCDLAGIADSFLVHDRAILRPLDDSIIRVIANTPTVLRRARGFVPTSIRLSHDLPATLAVGGQQKNTVAIAQHSQVILSQHLGDLHALASVQQHSATIADLSQFYNFSAQQVVCDTHPDYASSQYAQRLQLPVQTVQHHYAHVLSCMAEHDLKQPLLGVAWDGTGLGNDNELWGGEFLQIEANGFRRVAHLRPFPLVGGGQAIKEPRRAALGLLYAWQGDALFTPEFAPLLTAFTSTELSLLRGLLNKQLNCPLTSSIGRLFDAFASLLGLCQRSEFEGQAAMALEQCAMSNEYTSFPRTRESINHMTSMDSRLCGNDEKRGSGSDNTPCTYPIAVIEGEPLILDWQPLLQGVLTDINALSTAQIAAKIHHSLAAWLFVIAGKTTATRLVLSGGCFQNAYLVEAITAHKAASDYALFTHAHVPPNDGGLALGQIYSIVSL